MKKLKLNRETIRDLSSIRLRLAAGGISGDCSNVISASPVTGCLQSVKCPTPFCITPII